MAVPNQQEKKFIGTYFVNCKVYGRSYLNESRDAYNGNCPRCGQPIRIRAGSGGKNVNFVKVYCATR